MSIEFRISLKRIILAVAGLLVLFLMGTVLYFIAALADLRITEENVKNRSLWNKISGWAISKVLGPYI